MLFTVIPLIVGLAPVMEVLENVASVVTGEVEIIFIRLLGAVGFGGGRILAGREGFRARPTLAGRDVLRVSLRVRRTTG